MYDPFEDRRTQRTQRRYYRNSLSGLSGGVFMLALLFAFLFGHVFGGAGFLVWLFIGLAFAALFGSLSSMSREGIYGGLHGFVWMLGLALCFWIGFWPWILLPMAISAMLGSLFVPITAALAGMGFLAASQARQQPYRPQGQPDYEPYQQGYQGELARPLHPTLQEQSSQDPKQQYEQPQVEYPEQELPPMEQH
ncbi:MAG TPA: hypothetical protein VKV19_12455 [Ktedonobacteraceae bacterium]|nr:hypothetical protein [Ktedonobacteraceae bacterium]